MTNCLISLQSLASISVPLGAIGSGVRADVSRLREMLRVMGKKEERRPVKTRGVARSVEADVIAVRILQELAKRDSVIDAYLSPALPYAATARLLSRSRLAVAQLPLVQRKFLHDRVPDPRQMRRAGFLQRILAQPYAESSSDLLHPSAGAKRLQTSKQTIANQTEEFMRKLGQDHKLSPEVFAHIRSAYATGYAESSRTQWWDRFFMNAVGKTVKWGLVLLIGFYIYSKVFSSLSIKVDDNPLFGSQQTSPIKAEKTDVKFADVCGAKEAKQELMEVVEFLKTPDKFSSLGAKLPKGVLLVGSPGVGKTLLARAVAGEADVAFLHACGSDFDELWVGSGARRIRQLFQQAKKNAPCVIFIDEFDSVGRNRVTSELHPYANQTINQLLAEMDGFEKNEGVIVLAATNKPEALDAAMLRPGRFDVKVHIHLPDLPDRREMFEYYLNKVAAGSDVDVEVLARSTQGFTGADISNMVNQAALRAAVLDKAYICRDDLMWAFDKVSLGPARSRLPDEDENRNTAYHEAGHAIVAHFTPKANPVAKVTIIPHGMSLGSTLNPDEKDYHSRTYAQLRAQLDVAMGGRAAEEIMFGTENVTTGASSDLQAATRIARQMVEHLGMSEKFGLQVSSGKSTGGAARDLADQEVQRLLHESYERAKRLLEGRRRELLAVGTALLREETINGDRFRQIVDDPKAILDAQPKSGYIGDKLRLGTKLAGAVAGTAPAKDFQRTAAVSDRHARHDSAN